jgi:sulfofructose kinase
VVLIDSSAVHGHVVCIGAATLDTIAVVPHHPAPDGRVEASDVALAGGGPAATAAVALARLGIPVFLVGRVGDDDAGPVIREGLEREGVDVSELAVCRGGRSARSSVLVDERARTRSIAAFTGALPPLTLGPRAQDLCRRSAWVHVDHAGYACARELARAARLSVDAGNPIDGLDLGAVAVFAPSEAALERMYPRVSVREALARALAAGPELVVVTRGAKGSVAATSEEAYVEAPAYPADVRSTLGAGDVFHGALLAGLVEDRTLKESLARANAAAALSCRALDGRSAIPTAAELDAALEL